MELQEMFTMQKNLDQHIKENHHLEDEDLFDKKILALLVEIGELANETRCFKFWSLKPSSPQETVLEEYVDGIHFILSLGIESGFEKLIEVENKSKSDATLTEQFLKVYEKIYKFRSTRSVDAYKEMFAEYLLLGLKLDFSSDGVKNAYITKNEVNYKRQEEGY